RPSAATSSRTVDASASSTPTWRTPPRTRSISGSGTNASATPSCWRSRRPEVGRSPAIGRRRRVTPRDRHERDLTRLDHPETFPREPLEGRRVVEVRDPPLQLRVLLFELIRLS